MSEARTSDTIEHISVEVESADFDDLLERVEMEGVHVTLTREQVAVAALVPWSHYRKAREGLARLELAYWTAWTDAGTFHAEALRQTVADFVEDRCCPPSATERGPVEPSLTGESAGA